MKGQCLCRSVTIEVENAPEFINICNCRLCRKLGSAWGYYLPQAITLSGATTAYSRDDLGYQAGCETHFCTNCGTSTHFVVTHPDHEGVGVNTRLFEQETLQGIAVHYYDTRSRNSPEDQPERTGEGTIGDGHSF